MRMTAIVIAVASLVSLPTRADEAADRQAFADRCAKCHGESGTGTFMLGRRYGKERAMLEKRDDFSAEFIRHVVRNGIVSMPAITRVEVSNQELDAIVRYLTRPRSGAVQPSIR